MQYHLNGFRPGDPDLAPAAEDLPQGDGLPAEVDVLIVGCGPAGLTLAAQLARFPGIHTRIVEQKPGPIERGQADGVSCRSMEMFQAFGFAHQVLKEAYWVNETTFWKPDPDRPGEITRSGRILDTEEGLSEMPHVILNQARVHAMYLDRMRRAPRRLVPDYHRRLETLTVDHGASHPVTVTLANEATGTAETLRARHVVGCDGARSAVRRAIGRRLTGDSANKAWGVIDMLAVTDFPDVRLKTLIQSQSEGSIVLIPREGGYLFRMYIELDKLAEDERARSRNITADDLVAAAGRILRPYTLEVKEVVWWSVYEIGQRLTDRFDNLDPAAPEDRLPAVFIAGDACHTHSPKAGQGMNVSMGDAFNLGWKLAGVLQGRLRPKVLRSYSEERQAVAADLIAFDREWSRIVAQRPEEGGDAAGETGEPLFQKYFIEHGRYTAGMSVRYQPSALTGPDTHQHLATGFGIGTRFHSAPVVRLGDAKPLQLGHVVEADGRWRLFAFAGSGDPAGAGPLRDLCRFLAGGPLRRHTPAGMDIDGVIDVSAVFQQGHRRLDLGAMPALLLPRKGRYWLTDYEKMFCADPAADIFDMRGIDRQQGCAVIVRPDQHVAHVLPLTAHEQIARFFEGFLRTG